MKDMLDLMASMATGSVEIRADPNRMRSSDKPVLIGDCSKLNELGWIPQISLDQTLLDILTYWREKIAK